MCVSVCVCVPLKRWTLIQIKARCVSEIETKAAQTSSVCSCFLSLSPSVSLSHLALLCPPPNPPSIRLRPSLYYFLSPLNLPLLTVNYSMLVHNSCPVFAVHI